jgi:uncharacterized protein YbbC (DUF1343 family)
VNARILALACLLAPAVGASGAEVQVGLERVDVPGGGVLRGKRIGLLCHGASVTADGRRAVDVLRSRGVDVVRLFAPEHGLGGDEGAGVAIAGGRDAATGVPIVSLYGAKTGPSPGDLAGLDVLVVDLQDVGVRFYTYAATMLVSLEAARAGGLEIVVLDRPNPLGGEDVEGPETDAPNAGHSLLAMTPGPLVHGLTLGEMARLASAGSGARLTVVPMTGWTRTMRWADTGRRWVPPSPNLRTADAALVYPGIALLEATNVSEGRGTGDPFLLFGAPWLRSAELIDRVRIEGIRLEMASFVPAASRAAPRPKFEGVGCAGARISIVRAEGLRPYAFGLSLLAALRTTPGFRWLDEGRRLDALLGTPRVREALERGTPVEEILASDGEAITSFRARVKDLLLY